MDYSYMYNDLSSSSSAISTAGVAALTAGLTVYLVVLIAVAVVQIIAMWKIFSKAGEKGWKSIIPIYNTIILFKIAGLSPWLVLVYLAAIIPFVGWIAVFALTAYMAYMLAKSFGKDIAWAIGIFFLAPIFYMILGFGSSEYIAPGGDKSPTQV